MEQVLLLGDQGRGFWGDPGVSPVPAQATACDYRREHIIFSRKSV